MDDRRDDWRHGVDENLASLNAGQRVWDREVVIIRKALAEMDALLRGDRQNDTDGAIARLHQLENSLNLLKAVILKDSAGSKGLVGRVEALESGERRSEIHLKVWIAVVGLISAVAVGVLSNLDRIQAFLNKPTQDPVDRAIERAVHPKPRHRHYVIQAEPEAPTEQ